MATERYVILGLAPARAAWFSALARWTNSAALAAEFVKCVSAEEVRVRLAGGRQHSVLLVDATVSGFDRDLVDRCAGCATPVVVVRQPRDAIGSAADLGAAGELAPDFTPADLLEILGRCCRPVARSSAMPPPVEDRAEDPVWQASMFAVCGPGGTGASTVAAALACGLGRDPRYGGRVLLADLARRADQAVLHDSPDLGPGVQELVEAHRLGRPPPDEVDRATFEVPQRGYRLLLGLRRPEAWSALRPRAVDAALAGLRRTFTAVVADVTGDFEGEADGGSVEVEERNHLARAAALQSTVVTVVGAPGLKGVHSLANTCRELVALGVAPERILAVVNRSPRHPRSRAETARALAALLEASGVTLALACPVAIPERKLEEVHRDVRPLPAALVDPVTRALHSVAARVADAAPPSTGPTAISPGSLSTWADPEVGAQ